MPRRPDTPLILIHAAAAVAAHQGIQGSINIDTVVAQLFDIEEKWWVRLAARQGLGVSRAALRAAVASSVLVGASDQADAERLLRGLPGLGRARSEVIGELALRVRSFYPHRAGGWLDPHLPGRLAESFVADQVAHAPRVQSALVSAALGTGRDEGTAGDRTAGTRAARMLTVLANASRHSPTAHTTISTLIGLAPRALLPIAVDVALTGSPHIDSALVEAVESAADLSHADLRDLDAYLPYPTQALAQTAVCVAQRRVALAPSSDERAQRQVELCQRLTAVGSWDEVNRSGSDGGSIP